MTSQTPERVVPVTRRQYLTIKAMETAPLFIALEAVASTAIEHPEWDMNEERTWAAWETDNEVPPP